MPDFRPEIRSLLKEANLAGPGEEEIVEELAADLEERYEDALSHGATEEEARCKALEELTRPKSIADELRPLKSRRQENCPSFGAQRLRNNLAGVMDDLRFGLRMLRKQPGFTVIAVITLGIGIGASTAMLSLVEGVLLKPLPYAHADRQYAIWASADSVGQRQIAASRPDFVDYLEQNKSFTHLAEYIPRFAFTWTGEGEPRLVTCTGVSEQFFAVLGVRPYLGRLYEPREYTYFNNDTILISHRFWMNQLGGDRHVIGRKIHLQGEVSTIVGVLPPMSDLFPETDVWAKLTIRPSYPFMQWRGNKFLRVIGGLRSGVTPAMAEDDLTGILRRAPEEPHDVRVRLVPLKDDLTGNVRLPLLATLAAAAIILTVACINVAALLLARAVKREGEMATRLSVGAGLSRIAQQLITEAVLLSAAGCAAGLFLAWAALRILRQIPNLPLPRLDQVHLNAPALMVTAAITVATTIAFGWIPSFSFSRLNLSSALRPRGIDFSGRRGGALSALVIAEIGCSVMLTISVGLLLHSFWRVVHVDPGFERQSLLRVYLRSESPPNTEPALTAYTQEAEAFWQGVVREASSVPGVRSAAISDWRPGRDAATASLVFEDRPNDTTHLPTVESSWVSFQFFQTIGARLVAGRLFQEHDIADAPPVAVINAEAAHQFWPGQNAIGKRIAVNYTGAGRRTDGAPRMREIVGVVANIKHGPLDSAVAPAVYLPYLQDETKHTMSAMSLLVRWEGHLMGIADALRQRIHAVRADQPVEAVQSVEDLVAQSVAPRRYLLLLLAAFGAIGLLLAAIGVYGVISYATSQRTREFGLRMALGATRARVISHVLHSGGKLTLFGVVAGVLGAVLLTRSLASLLFEIDPLDVWSFSGAIVLLVVTSICACFVPAWRASRVDPIIAISTE